MGATFSTGVNSGLIHKELKISLYMLIYARMKTSTGNIEPPLTLETKLPVFLKALNVTFFFLEDEWLQSSKKKGFQSVLELNWIS